jgi:hypothetical protein
MATITIKQEASGECSLDCELYQSNHMGCDGCQKKWEKLHEVTGPQFPGPMCIGPGEHELVPTQEINRLRAITASRNLQHDLEEHPNGMILPRLGESDTDRSIRNEHNRRVLGNKDVLVKPELVAAVRKMIAYQGKNCDYQNENQSCWACGESMCRYHEINFLLPREDNNERG